VSRLSVIKVMLISRNHILRLGVQNVLTTAPHLRLIEPRSGELQADETFTREQPHIIIIDLEHELDLARLLYRLRLLVPQAKIILLIGIEEGRGTEQACSSEVDGVILNVQPPEVLIAYINSFFNIPAETLQDIETTSRPPAWKQAAQPEGPSDSQPTAILTVRERDVIRLVGQGLSNKDIADHLCLSAITVRHHLTSIFDKLGVTTRQKLLIRAHQYGHV
jgi:DNA-binding NarL/FixJ family response regulator